MYQKGVKLFKVDSRIIKLFFDSDEIIKENKDILIYDKYKCLGETFIKQRKTFFDSLLNEKKINIKIYTGYNQIKMKYNSLPQINIYKALMSNYKNKIDNLFPKSMKNNMNNKVKMTNFKEDLDKLWLGVLIDIL